MLPHPRYFQAVCDHVAGTRAKIIRGEPIDREQYHRDMAEIDRLNDIRDAARRAFMSDEEREEEDAILGY